MARPAFGNRHFLDRPVADCRHDDRVLGGVAMDARTMMAALWLSLGLAGGATYFALLRRNASLYSVNLDQMFA